MEAEIRAEGRRRLIGRRLPLTGDIPAAVARGEIAPAEGARIARRIRARPRDVRCLAWLKRQPGNGAAQRER